MSGRQTLAAESGVEFIRALTGAWDCCGTCAGGVLLRHDREVAEAALAPLLAVHSRYFDMDGRPGFDDTTPEPEDVWRYDRDFRAALTPATPTDHQSQPAGGGSEET